LPKDAPETAAAGVDRKSSALQLRHRATLYGRISKKGREIQQQSISTVTE